MRPVPNKTIGGIPFAKLYPQWQQILAYTEQQIKAHTESDPPITPRQYLVEEKKFQQFFVSIMQKRTDLGVSREQIEDIWQDVHNEFFGFGMIRVYLEDPEVEDVLMDSWKRLDVVKKGKKYSLRTPFLSETDAQMWMKRMMERQGKQLNENFPSQDGRLQDGSRIICLLPPIVSSAGFAIRKHKVERFDKEIYKKSGVATAEFFEDLNYWVQSKKNILICGATGSGKTTLTNFTASLIPDEERILVIEDTRELLLPNPRAYSMTSLSKGSREKNLNDAWAITIRDLLKNALRMKPDRIIVGETRGPEAFDMLDGMNTGHSGGITTLHANSPSEAILRLEALALPANPNMTEGALQDLIGSTIDIIIQMKQHPTTGQRLVVEAAQIFHPSQTKSKQALEAPTKEIKKDKIYLRPLWLWNREHNKLERVSEAISMEGQYF